MKQYHTYLHRGQDGRVFYVGCAAAYMERAALRARYQRAHSSNGHSKAWHVAAAGGYSVEVLEHFTERSKAFEAEKRLIQEMRHSGEPLVNICDGGPGMPGAKDSLEVRLKKSITKLGELNPMHGKTGAAHPNSRRVRDTATGAVYPSVTAAAKAAGLSMQGLHNMLTGHRVNTSTMELV